MRMILGIVLSLVGVALIVSAGIGGDFGERHLWAVVVGGGALFLGIGMLLKSAWRMVILVLGGICLLVGIGMGLFDVFS